MDYNLSSANNLLKNVNQLANFSDVLDWDNQAKQEVQKLDLFIEKLTDAEQKTNVELAKSQLNFSSKPFFAKLFSPDGQSKKYKAVLKSILLLKPQIENVKDKLDYWISATPDNDNEAKQMLGELKLAKKELGVQKKEVRANIKQINTNARISNANISNQIFFTNPKLKRAQRISVRANKENAVKPHENELFEIDRQILEIDKLINWIDRIRF